MQKLSRALLIGAAVSLTLTACHPPHQQDSDVKVPNASTFTGQSPVEKEAPTSSEAAEPTILYGDSAGVAVYSDSATDAVAQ